MKKYDIQFELSYAGSASDAHEIDLYDVSQALVGFQRSTEKIPVRLVAIDIQKALQLTLKFNIYAYDAYFLQCAVALSSPLLTLDNRMKKVATELGIEVLE